MKWSSFANRSSLLSLSHISNLNSIQASQETTNFTLRLNSSVKFHEVMKRLDLTSQEKEGLR